MRYRKEQKDSCNCGLAFFNGEKGLLQLIVLHGLNAIYLESIGKWIRVDARGNKLNVNAEFSIDEEKLASKIREEIGEFDSPVIYAKPDSNVITALRRYETLNELLKYLPAKLAD